MDKAALPSSLCLCVQLDADFFYLIRSYVERGGLKAEYITRPADVLSCAKQSHPVALFFETDRPALFPIWDMIEGLKSDKDTASIPVILFSWLDEEPLAEEKGVDVFVRKPVMFGDFLSAMEAAGVCINTPDTNILDEKRR
jgi:CheY-like chemotaxis protein